MNTATSGAEPTPQTTEKNSEMSGNISDVSQQKVNAVNPDAQPADPQEKAPAPEQAASSEGRTAAPRVTKATPDYSAYMDTDAAKSPLHGIYAVYPFRVPNGEHTTGKQPCDLNGHVTGGVHNFVYTAEDVMKVFSSQPIVKSVVASVRSFLIRNAKKAEDIDYLRTVDISLCLGRFFPP